MYFLLFALLSGVVLADSKDDYKTVSISVPLLVISSRENPESFKMDYGIQFSEIIQMNRLALPLSLGNESCRSSYRSFNTYKVVEIISKKVL
ncbi:MAG: hypothetical protein OXN83_01460 [Oligoflexia bacterium]|nr:hypothetical protein [Oligoflexia bacterium]